MISEKKNKMFVKNVLQKSRKKYFIIFQKLLNLKICRKCKKPSLNVQRIVSSIIKTNDLQKLIKKFHISKFFFLNRGEMIQGYLSVISM